MKRTQPMNLTKPLWKWRKEFGRLRLGRISYKDWWLGGAYKWAWWFVFRIYPIRYYANSSTIKVGGYFQLTVFGFQIAYCYRKDFINKEK